LFKAQFLPHTDLRSSMFERNFVHGEFHQMDAASMFGFEVFNRQGIRHHLGVESLPLIANDDAHAFEILVVGSKGSQGSNIEVDIQ